MSLFRFGRTRILLIASSLTACVVIAILLSPAASGEVRPLLQSLGVISCTSTGPCQEGNNSGTGAGLEGLSALGNGVIGHTTSNGTSGKAGVLGSDLATTGTFNSGVEGVSIRNFGVFGVSTNGSGVKAVSSTGFGITAITSGGASTAAVNAFTSGSGAGVGVLASSANGTAVNAQSTNAQGMIVRSINNDGIDAGTSHNSKATGQARSGVFAHDDSIDGGTLNFGVYGTSTNGTGVFAGTVNGTGLVATSTQGVGVLGVSTNGVAVQATSTNFVGLNVMGGFFDSTHLDDLPALSLVGNSAGGKDNLLIAACAVGTVVGPCTYLTSVFSVNANGSIIVAATNGTIKFSADATNGNVNITGQYQIKGSCVIGCVAPTTTSAGRSAVTYASEVSQPTLEDVGETELVDGQAYVRIDPKFANVIDQSANYLVFITPEGDANVLYVTQKSASGFTVRESHGGRSTLMFSYRITAKPFGSHEPRLPMVAEPRLPGGRSQARAHHP